jgi:O-antigen/teichoic acid export membrane protein
MRGADLYDPKETRMTTPDELSRGVEGKVAGFAKRLRLLSESASIIIVSRLGGVLLSLMSVPILARVLGPEGRGQSAAAISIILLLPVLLSYGTPILTRQAFAQTGHLGEPLLRAIRVYATAAGAATAVLALPLSWLLLPGLSVSASVAFCVSLPIAVTSGILWICNASVMIGRKESLRYAVVIVLPSFVLSISVIILWGLGSLTVASAIWAQLASYVATFIVSHLLVRVSLAGGRSPVHSLLRESSKFAGGQIAEAASFRLDQALVLPLLGAHQAGLYSIAATIALLPYSIGQAIAAATFRQASAESHSENGESSQPQSELLLRIALIVGFASSIGLGLLVPWVIPAVFGEDYAGAVIPTWIGLFGAVALVVAQSADTLLVVRNQGWRMTIAQVAGLFAALVLLFVLGLPFGILGASIASVIGYLITTVMLLRWLGVTGKSFFVKRSDWTSIRRLLSVGKY